MWPLRTHQRKELAFFVRMNTLALTCYGLRRGWVCRSKMLPELCAQSSALAERICEPGGQNNRMAGGHSGCVLSEVAVQGLIDCVKQESVQRIRFGCTKHGLTEDSEMFIHHCTFAI